MFDCVLISQDDDFRRQVLELSRHPESPVRLMLDLPQTAADLPRDALGKILDADPALVFVDLGEASTMGVRVIEALAQEAPDMGIIAAGPKLTAEALLEVMRAGASEYLPRPLETDEVSTALGRVRRRLATSTTEDPGARGKVTTVFSAKGGTGVTVLAANLAVVLEEMTRQPVLLLDLAPSLGTAALTLGLQARYSYLDVIRNYHRIDEELLRSFLEVHESGVAVLASPPHAGDAEAPSEEQIRGLIRFCRRHFSHVVIDGGSTLAGPVSAALSESTERVLVTTAELPTLRNLKRALELVRPLATNGAAPARLVLNQYREGGGVSVKEVEQALGLDVFETLDRDDEAVIRSLNTGRPAVPGKSRFARGLNRIGRELAGPDRVEEDDEGLLGSILRPFRNKN